MLFVHQFDNMLTRLSVSAPQLLQSVFLWGGEQSGRRGSQILQVSYEPPFVCLWALTLSSTPPSRSSSGVELRCFHTSLHSDRKTGGGEWTHPSARCFSWNKIKIIFLHVFSLDKELFLSFNQDKYRFLKIPESFLNFFWVEIKAKTANTVSRVRHRGGANNTVLNSSCIWDLKSSPFKNKFHIWGTNRQENQQLRRELKMCSPFCCLRPFCHPIIGLFSLSEKIAALLNSRNFVLA